MLQNRADWIPRCAIPNASCVVDTRRREQSTIGTELSGRHCIVVLNRQESLARLRTPNHGLPGTRVRSTSTSHPDKRLTGPGDHAFVIETELRRPNRLGVTQPWRYCITRYPVPDPARAI